MDRRIFTVSETNKYIKGIIERDFILRKISVSGEISTLTKHSSGHYYFSLKDEFNEISCIMFSYDTKKLKMDIKNGDKIIVTGRVSVYEARGKYQIYVSKIEKFGLGELYIRLEKLKAKLDEEGLFDTEHKKQLPKYPSTIGVVTSAMGAAIKDIVKVSASRNDGVKLKLYDSLVQGENAKNSIVKGIQYLDKNCDVDIIIVGRGGGSFEDLMAFNEEDVARAIFNCETPIISAVGHERDFTISDLVCDVRAATPSDAALIAVPDKNELKKHLQNMQMNLSINLDSVIYNKESYLNLLKSKINLLSPKNKLDLNTHMIIDLERRLQVRLVILILNKESKLKDARVKLDNVYPINKLKDGYGYVYTDDKHISKVSDVKKGDDIVVALFDGEIRAKVTEVVIKDGEKRI